MAHGTPAIFGGWVIIKLQKIKALTMAPQGRSTKAASAPDLSNSTQGQGAKATAKDIQNVVLLVSIQLAAGG